MLIFLLYVYICCFVFFFFKQKTAYEIKECDWSSDVCSSDLFDHSRRSGLTSRGTRDCVARSNNNSPTPSRNAKVITRPTGTEPAATTSRRRATRTERYASTPFMSRSSRDLSTADPANKPRTRCGSVCAALTAAIITGSSVSIAARRGKAAARTPSLRLAAVDPVHTARKARPAEPPASLTGGGHSLCWLCCKGQTVGGSEVCLI